MKTINYNYLFIIALLLFTVVSCENDDGDNTSPEIAGFELGMSNSQIVYQGNGVHLEFEAIDNEELGYYEVEIHTEGGDLKSTLADWEFYQRWDFEEGLKNTLIHHHEILVPVDATTGTYHFHLTLVDAAGNSLVIERELEVQELQDNTAPVITIESAPEANAAFANGATISISGSVTDDIALGGLYVGLVGVSQNLTDAEVTHENSISLLHIHDFDMPAQHTFTAGIEVGADTDNDYPEPKPIDWQSGDYYILVKSPDAAGNVGFSAHYPVTITLE